MMSLQARIRRGLAARLSVAAHRMNEWVTFRFRPWQDVRSFCVPGFPRDAADFNAFLAHRNRAGILPYPGELGIIVDRIAQQYPEETQSLLASADRLLAGDFAEYAPLAAGERHFPPLWFHDRTTGAEWPRNWFRSIDYSSDKRPGEIRHLWDLHRQLFLPRLAQAYRISGKLRYLDGLKLLYHDWWESNPVGRGIAWIGPQIQEHAFRNIQWMLVFQLLQGSLDANDPFLRELLAGIYMQGKVLAFYYRPDKPLSHNHLVAESSGLWLTCSLFPEFDYSTAHRDTAGKGLARALDVQLLEDGVHAEHASAYHCYVLEHALVCVLVSRRLGGGEFDGLKTKLLAAARYAARLVQPDGSIPYLGDSDDAIVCGLSARPHSRRMRHASTAACLFVDPDLAAIAGGLDPETLWLFGSEATKSWRPSEPPERRWCESFQGTCTLIGESRASGTRLLFRAGPSRIVPAVGAGHCHADWNQVTLWMRGKEILTDPGTYLYNASDELRHQYRSTRSHSTVMIDGRDHCDVSSHRFAVGQLPPPPDFLARSGWPLLAGSTVRLGKNRHVKQLFCEDDFLFLLDTIEGEFEEAECSFILPEELPEELLLLRLYEDGNVEPVPADKAGWAGYVSRRYGKAEPAVRRVSRLNGRDGRCFRHLILHRDHPLPSLLVSARPESPGAVCWKMENLTLIEPGAGYSDRGVPENRTSQLLVRQAEGRILSAAGDLEPDWRAGRIVMEGGTLRSWAEGKRSK